MQTTPDPQHGREAGRERPASRPEIEKAIPKMPRPRPLHPNVETPESKRPPLETR